MPLRLRSLLCICACLSLTAQAEVVSDSTLRWGTPPVRVESTLQLMPAQALTRELPLQIQDEPAPLPTIDLTMPPDDLWQRVRNGFSMPNLDSPLVADRQAWYLNRPEMLKRVLDRSRRYLYYIVGELEKRGMPTELALLPIVESSYNPMAYSPARASGIWQFIPSTGKNYRLEQNWWLDERRDIIASTGAALDYLQAIYELHGDWHLALASYNWGENAVARAVVKNQAKHLPTDYASLSMPSETRYYVPKLQALKNIIAQPQLFGINLNPIPNQAYFDVVDKPANMDLSLAAKLAETPLDEFLALNPSYNRPVMPASKDSPLVLPAGKVQTFLANLQQHERQEKPLSNWHTYKLKKGEKIDAVATRFHLTPTYLKQINGITRRTRLLAGSTLLVPRKDGQTNANLHEVNLPLTPPELPKNSKKAGKKGGKKTTVKSGKYKRQIAAGAKKSGKSLPARKSPPAKKRLPAKKH
ncbi:MAG: transglycosylase SLT domain-containing protein [Sterolibacterium sp.]|nr:transglycosylase SLT domain-containing protein [Sterolibacterium sp.]